MTYDFPMVASREWRVQGALVARLLVECIYCICATRGSIQEIYLLGIGSYLKWPLRTHCPTRSGLQLSPPSVNSEAFDVHSNHSSTHLVCN